jgi:hypothetical protein
VGSAQRLLKLSGLQVATSHCLFSGKDLLFLREHSWQNA